MILQTQSVKDNGSLPENIDPWADTHCTARLSDQATGIDIASMVAPSTADELTAAHNARWEEQQATAERMSVLEFLQSAGIRDALDAIVPGLSPQQLEMRVDRVLDALASKRPIFEVEFNEYVGQLVKKLKGCGYTSSSPAKYRKMCRDMYRVKESQRKNKAENEEFVRTGKPLQRFVAVGKGLKGASDDPKNWGMYDRDFNRTGGFITNFVLILTEDVAILDDIESHRIFKGTLTLFGKDTPFQIRAEDFADNNKLKAALYAAGGPEVQIHCKIDLLRTAISTLSGLTEKPVQQRKVTTNFGWTADANAYLVPNGAVKPDGIEPGNAKQSLLVDLKDEEYARYLDMKTLVPDELSRVKQHIVDDLLALHDPVVTRSLLGTAAAAVLQNFSPGLGRFALWLVGLTGAGKSYLAKLFMNFFGDFPVASGRFATWSSTPNYIQRQGYFFKDAMFLVDDFKPEVVLPYQVVRILQTYADGTARGRLKSDSTTNVSRPIRGLLLCTGEDVPEHNASALARSIVVKVPQRAKDIERGARCVAECKNYSGVMADFIRWLLANDKTVGFADRVQALQQRLYVDVAGQQNDTRITANLALLGAAFELIAEYLSDVWPEWNEQVRQVIEVDLLAIRGDMIGEAKEQQASEVFLATLGELVRYQEVRIDGHPRFAAEGKEVIGLWLQGRFSISTKLAMAAVNDCLRRQGRALLRVTEKALLQQLREDGRLWQEEGNREVEPTQRIRLAGRQMRSFVIEERVLLGP